MAKMTGSSVAGEFGLWVQGRRSGHKISGSQINEMCKNVALCRCKKVSRDVVVDTLGQGGKARGPGVEGGKDLPLALLAVGDEFLQARFRGLYRITVAGEEAAPAQLSQAIER